MDGGPCSPPKWNACKLSVNNRSTALTRKHVRVIELAERKGGGERERERGLQGDRKRGNDCKKEMAGGRDNSI